MEIDINKLRRDLLDYYGTAMEFFPQAVIDLSQIENADKEQLIDIAQNNNIDLSNYEIKSKNR